MCRSKGKDLITKCRRRTEISPRHASFLLKLQHIQLLGSIRLREALHLPKEHLLAVRLALR